MFSLGYSRTGGRPLIKVNTRCGDADIPGTMDRPASPGGGHKVAAVVAKLDKAVRNSVNKKVLHLGYASVGYDSIHIVLRHLRLHNVLEVDLRCNGINPDGTTFMGNIHLRISEVHLRWNRNRFGFNRTCSGSI